MLIHGRFKKRHRGTELLDELAEVLPALSQFTEEEYLDFAAAITVINSYWLELHRDTNEGGIARRSEFIRILNRMFVLYCHASKPCSLRRISHSVSKAYPSGSGPTMGSDKGGRFG
jgi:hypothetical protein